MPQLTSKKQQGRNERCGCGSGLKAKHCHLDPGKRAVCERVMAEKMVELILREKIKKGMICCHGVETGKYCKDCAVEIVDYKLTKEN